MCILTDLRKRSLSQSEKTYVFALSRQNGRSYFKMPSSLAAVELEKRQNFGCYQFLFGFQIESKFKRFRLTYMSADAAFDVLENIFPVDKRYDGGWPILGAFESVFSVFEGCIEEKEQDGKRRVILVTTW